MFRLGSTVLASSIPMARFAGPSFLGETPQTPPPGLASLGSSYELFSLCYEDGTFLVCALFPDETPRLRDTLRSDLHLHMIKRLQTTLNRKELWGIPRKKVIRWPDRSQPRENWRAGPPGRDSTCVLGPSHND
jgi:hypothetical protein